MTRDEIISVIEGAIEQAGGSPDDLMASLKDEGKIRLLGALLVSKHELGSPSQLLGVDLIPEGWRVVEDCVPRGAFEMAKLATQSVLEPHATQIRGTRMLKKARTRGLVFSLGDGRYMLGKDGCGKDIVVNRHWQSLMLTGTVLLDEKGNRCIAYLRREGEGWRMSFCLLETVFYYGCAFPDLAIG